MKRWIDDVFRGLGHGPRNLSLWALLLWGWMAALAQGLPVKPIAAGDLVRTEQVQARLLAHAPQGVEPGGQFWLGLQLEHQPQWHTYWRNPGDSGLATTLSWSLPQGLSAGDIQWPLPRKLPIGPLANFGYEGQVVLAVPIRVAKDFRTPADGMVSVALDAEWLVCRLECIPQQGHFRIQLPVRGATALHASLFEKAHASVPRPMGRAPASGTEVLGAKATLQEGGRMVLVEVRGLPLDWRGHTLSLFPVTPQVLRHAAVQDRDWTQTWQGGVWQARMPVSEDRMEAPDRLRWVIAQGPEREPQGAGLEMETPVQGRWPEPTAPASVVPSAVPIAPPAMPTTPSPAMASFWLACLAAAFGGLLLNLMPCVFPVLAIKLIGLSKASSARAQRAGGLVYGLGVVISLVLLGALMLALRSAGEQLGWGFQLQSPWVVSGLAWLFTLLALNLAGLLETGSWMPSSWMGWSARHPMLDALGSGVLSVLVATPCTAPFMGASLGLAITLPAWQALAVFASMGLGMAAPFVLMSFFPSWAKRLPRSGPWMQWFRQAMVFPMLATVVWLLWVLAQQTGPDTSFMVLASLVVMTALAWSLGLPGRWRWALGSGLMLTLIWIGTSVLPDRLRASPASPALAEAMPASPGRWQAWSEDRVKQALAAGQTVLVDYTAAWCITCQYNKKTVLSDERVNAAMDAAHVLSLRADWTRRDSAITASLNALGRNGVPVYVIWKPGQPPRLLSEMPSVQEVLENLARP